ncbi:FAD-binding and (Fe-S)-binding domain-containing protein [Variovorax saccharolyticus]|uniref:FAD-binding and (Fe-S)-binding domain-containing protein n=1 Tax=Variovorax saccharolyticus TaxID=3053516 RepID=UPI002578442D|nr:FAD-binding and (Fe-S)-binding domain-containing protein [Variovorax sp. J22R187]MDM0022826.1 FAD-binding and (Fe-S)-binding domain-containing protein [Variovorax sp. J22R187]
MFKKLLASDPELIGRPDVTSQVDALSEELVDGTPAILKSDLVALLGEDVVLHRAIDLVRYASDASAYRLIPQVVLLPRNADDVAKIFTYCRENKRHATFRAGGTSLNGQAQSDDILIDVRRHWYGAKVEADGLRLRARTGTILGHCNSMLTRYRRRLGPDPASESACTVGGVIANNSGGMRCTVQRDAYSTVAALTFVLPSGAIIDSSAADAESAFATAAPELASGLLDLQREILADAGLVARIRRKYSIRNTHGYRMCAFLDGDTPLQIFRRLLVGSQGTLAFVGEAVIETVPIPEVTGVAWIAFSSIDECVALVPDLVSLGATAVELMVAPALVAAAQAFEGTPTYWRSLDPNAAALLVEYGAPDARALALVEQQVEVLAARTRPVHPVEFTSVAEAIELAWHVREGLLGLVGKVRPAGSSMVIEDVCFPPERLAEGARDVQALLSKHGFLGGVAGHAAHGNLHFNLMADFSDSGDLDRYSAFMSELVDLIVGKYDGSLKAEHGTGMNMAPFLEREWGAKVTDIMWRLKALADPFGILAPDVILTRNPLLHLQSLKSVPTIENVTGSMHCIECGFCEPVCPSRNVTMTPRQRIVVRREMARQAPESPMLAKLQAEYQYDGIETCAGDGTCAIQCPVGINTGELIKSFRMAENGETAEAVALILARNWSKVESLTRTGLRATDIAAKVLGVGALTGIMAGVRTMVSNDLIPAIPGPMPLAAGALPATCRDGAAAVYFPACINRMFGREPGHASMPSLADALLAVSERAGRPLWIPSDVAGLCCSTPWHSKGYRRGHEFMANAIADALWRWSDGAALPVVVDAASCTLGLLDDVGRHLDPERKARHDQLDIRDSITWCHDLLPLLPISRKLPRVAVHPTCSIAHLGLVKQLNEIASTLADDVEVPIGTTCCGTGGDRGLLHPELVVSATREVKAALDAHPADAYLSANRTCEMGMLHATGRPYESFAFLLDELSRPISADRLRSGSRTGSPSP